MHRFDKGVQVRVHRLTTAVLDRYSTPLPDTAGEGERYTIVSIRLVNSGSRQFEADLDGRLLYGAGLTEAGRILLESAPGVALAPGKSLEHDFGFVVPEEYRDDVVFELTAGGTEKAIFVGTVRTR